MRKRGNWLWLSCSISAVQSANPMEVLVLALALALYELGFAESTTLFSVIVSDSVI
ncbi:MAG: hypothetical protein GKR95_11400 [Gammaproteobacteria bacterium]|nr:hypothetical protein [Gammaproteobacteria bacterium]